MRELVITRAWRDATSERVEAIIETVGQRYLRPDYNFDEMRNGIGFLDTNELMYADTNHDLLKAQHFWKVAEAARSLLLLLSDDQANLLQYRTYYIKIIHKLRWQAYSLCESLKAEVVSGTTVKVNNEEIRLSETDIRIAIAAGVYDEHFRHAGVSRTGPFVKFCSMVLVAKPRPSPDTIVKSMQKHRKRGL